MSRLIQNEIKKSLAEKILFGDLQAGGTVRVDLDLETDKPVLVVVPTPAPVPA
jgi:ATP-dependent Clp protease ATP-binding subunit ClpA